MTNTTTNIINSRNVQTNEHKNIVKAQFNKQFKTANESFFKGLHRYYIFMGSAGSGKSVDVAQILITKMSQMRFKGMNLLVVRKTKETHHASTMQELVKAIRVLGLTNQWKIPKNLSSGELYLQHKLTENEVKFVGVNNADDIEKLKSITFANGALTTVWIEEATEIRLSDFTVIDDRLRGDLKIINPFLTYQVVLSFNPVSPQNWIKGTFWDNPDELTLCSHSNYLGNRFCDEQFHKRMMRRRMYDPEGYRVYGLGEWGELGGLILPNVKIIDDEYPDKYFEDLRYGQDFGWNHATALLDLGLKNGDVYIRREIYEHEKTTAQVIALANDRFYDKNRKMNCDSAEPDRIKEWQNAGFNATPVKKRGAKISTGTGQSELTYTKAQIDWLRQRTIFIHSSCVNTIKEIQLWKWQKDKESGEYIDKPEPVLDDAMAALRYGTDDWRNGDSVYFLTQDEDNEY